jgi:hypothetical protein
MTNTIVSENVFLIFGIDAGEMVWFSAQDTNDAACARLNEMRDDMEAGRATRYEFLFVVPSPHFAAMY